MAASAICTNGLSLDKFFVNAVAGATGDDDHRPVGELNKGKSTSADVPSAPPPAPFGFILTTDEKQANKTLNFSIQTPSGLKIDAANATNFNGVSYTSGGPGYQVYEVELPLQGIAEEDQSGDWQMLISNPASTNKTIGYTASAIGQTQLHLSLDSAAQPSVVQSNQPLVAGLNLHSNGEKIAFMEASVTIKGFQTTLEQAVKQATGFNSIKDYVDSSGAHLRTEENSNNGELRTDANIADHLLSKDHPKLYRALRTYQDLQTIDLTSDQQRIKGVTKFKQRLTNLISIQVRLNWSTPSMVAWRIAHLSHANSPTACSSSPKTTGGRRSSTLVTTMDKLLTLPTSLIPQISPMW